ncbi:hypothetical protein P5V15_000218 [Pogonomyrmex californicus]
MGVSWDHVKSSSEENLLRCTTASREDYLSDDMSTTAPELTVRRPVYQQDELNHLCKYVKPKRIFSNEVSKRCKSIKPITLLKKSIPLIDWLSSYDWKNNILGDVVAGITVAVMHIPQGMAYAILGNVPPIVGIYMAFFPVLVYFFLGTSRHNSMGTFALVCMMTGKVVTTYSNPAFSTNNTSVENGTLISDVNHQYSPVEVATAVTFTVAVIQVTISYTIQRLYFLQEITIRTYILLRICLFALRLTYVDVFNSLNNINTTAVILSCITILALIFNNEVLKPRVSKLCPFPIPIEMLVVVIGTVVSMQMDLADTYNVITVGVIPVGLPVPSAPPLSLIPNILVDSIVITMVAYTISMSMALIFAQKEGYEVDSNQELVAQGLGNLVGSFFSCMPITASLSRSLIQQTVGGHTQLASLISCGILVSVLLWIGPFFQPLPRCVLASIIVVALKGMLTKVTEFVKFWRLDRIDAGIWAITFIVVILFDVEYGLLVGILLCIGRLLVLAMRPYTCKLALAPGTELYLDAKRYKGTVEIPGIRIFHYSGSLNFASRQYFREEVYKVAGIIPQKELNRRQKAACNGTVAEEIKKLRILILDFSALSHIDLAGANALRNIVDEYCAIQVSMYIAGCSGPVYETMRKFNLTEYNENHFFAMFPTVADAVHFAHSHTEVPSTPAWSTRIHDENYISRL